MADAGPGSPIEFIRFKGNTGKLEVCKPALAALRSVKGPVGVVSVCGRARTGKSYLLNQLLGQSTGFQVAASHKPCTKGLWMWSAPIPRTAPDGSQYHLVMLDSEGIDAYDQTTRDGVQIFALAVLLSSMFVFNQMGPIDEGALDRLSLVTELTKHIRVRADTQSVLEDPRELGGFTPAFLWVLRDFYLELEDDGTKISARDYLETALLPSKGAGADVEAKNQIRSSIKSLFPERDCCLLVRPVSEEEDLRRLAELPPQSLRPQFKLGVEALSALVMSRTAPKRLGGQAVTGPLLAALAEAYVKAMNDGAVPTISTAWQCVAEAECRKAVEAGEAHYRSTFDREVHADDAPLAAEHQRALAGAKAVFRSHAVGPPELRQRSKAALLAACSAMFDDMASALRAAADRDGALMLASASAHISSVSRFGGDFVSVSSAITSAVREYADTAHGPAKWPALLEWWGRQLEGGITDWAAHCRDKAHEEVSRVCAELEATQRALKGESARADAAERRSVDALQHEARLREQLAGQRKGFGACFSCIGGAGT